MREIGIVLRSPATATALESIEAVDVDNDVATDPRTEVATRVTEPLTARPVTPSSSHLPETPLPVIGPGLPSPSPTDARDLVRNTGSPSPAGRNAALPGTAFMGARDQGSRVVFVVDSSSSMASYNAMRSAKAALVTSLQALDDTQQFQVVFYNSTPRPMALRGETALFFATELNKTAARQYIAGMEPDAGTDHLPALKLALRWQPEVIYFLTDADEPQLTARELDDIRRQNQGRARIHSIEFGRGPALTDGPTNFLQKLAQQNGGTYRYQDVKRLADR
jgi:Ca-activated chloride channel family protein